jgi:RNA polymerase sigma-B factor
LVAQTFGHRVDMASLTADRGGHPRADTQRLQERFHRERRPADRDVLIERHLKLAFHLAHRYAAGRDREDLEQVASLALIKAVDRYDPSRGVAFTSFAVPTIIGEIKRYFRDLGWTVRVPRHVQELAARVDAAHEQLSGELGRTPTAAQLAERCEVGLEEVLEARQSSTAHFPDSLDRTIFDDEEVPMHQAMGHDDPELVRAEYGIDIDLLLSRLPQRDQAVLRLRFQHDLVQREIAALLGLSQMQVSRIITGSIAKLGND